MKITIQRSPKTQLQLRLPTVLFCSRLGAWMAARGMRKQGNTTVTYRQLYPIFRELKKQKRRYRKQEWNLIEHLDADGNLQFSIRI
ncbi:MAG: hypothetical protein IJW92_00850 [Clostridia bacterium]|nr:hypothetical protein [Clostridia bacterium]